ncbi:TetR/AcrR family transcriptional regulator [Gorillibacterium sp. sgz500922]|uniref:TetR/AcrR family transcriptional regulator n=1 Tax=Gorillibacterium sp. sgz500922 TaxID=3446694 RepID=UPI003F669B31
MDRPQSDPSSVEELIRQWTADGEPKKMTEKQRRILDSAIELFLEKSFAAASTSEIAQRAGVAEGTIFRHFKTKKDLLYSITVPMLLRLLQPVAIDDLTELLDTSFASFEDFLRSVLRNRYAFARKHLPILRILLQEIPFQPELRDRFFSTAVEQVGERLTRIIVHFQEKGEIARHFSPPTVIRLWLSVFAGFVATRLLLRPEAEWDDEAEIEACVRFAANGLKP